MKPILYMTKGLPGAGKTTVALRMVSTDGVKRVNKDDLRSMIDNSRWSKSNEQFIISVRNEIVATSLLGGSSIVVDDTNLDPKHETDLRNLANLYKADFQIIDCTDIPVEECVTRDAKRVKPVGFKVIMDMYNRYLKPASAIAPFDPALPDCIIVDIDGTVAIKHPDRGYYDWNKVQFDTPRWPVIRVVEAFARISSTQVIFVSGRDGSCYGQTSGWLSQHMTKACDWKLLMRVAGDNRRDSIVKREIYEQQIKDEFNVVAIFDDRPQVIRECWQDLGFGDRIFNVGSGEEF